MTRIAVDCQNTRVNVKDSVFMPNGDVARVVGVLTEGCSNLDTILLVRRENWPSREKPEAIYACDVMKVQE